MSNEQYEIRWGRPLGSGGGAGAGELVAGSRTWQVEQLECGEFLQKPDTNESARRSCLRAITTVTEREPAREYDVSLSHHLRPSQVRAV